MYINKVQTINSNYTAQNFKSKMFTVAGEKFAEDVLLEAKAILQKKGVVNVNNYKKSFMQCWKDAEFRPLEWLMEQANGSSDDTRVAVGFLTLGLSEIAHLPEALIRKIGSGPKARKFASEVKRCISALNREANKTAK